MARALALAERGRGSVRPNPLVGCVLVRDGEVVGEGFHERPGGPHAEVAALDEAGGRAAGATAYVTLEPCDHTGRTGPCTTALVDAAVRRVVYAVPDPNPAAAGGGDRLAAAGIEVEGGVLAAWAERQNDVFLSRLRTGRPHLTLKLAQTWDGALVAPGRRWVTGPAARTTVHRMRARADAVLVGVGTVLADDPRLDVRHVDVGRDDQPRPVVLDSHGRTPTTAKVVRGGAVVVTVDPGAPAWRRALAAAGTEVVTVAADDRGRVDPGAAMTALADRGIGAVLAEPGATLAASLVAAGVVDRLVVHVAGQATRSGLRPALAGCTRPPADADWTWRPVASGTLGTDLELVVAPGGRPSEQRRSA